jgi:23S rRNA (adenine2503-C2)-methyltransferase
LQIADLKRELAGFGFEDWRVKQVVDGLYRSRAFDFRNISTLPKEIKAALEEKASFFTLSEEKKLESRGDPAARSSDPAGPRPRLSRQARRQAHRRLSSPGTVKFLLGFPGGVRVECVGLPNTKDEYTFCLSTQAGCALKCAFCASGLDGCERNLLCHEIVEQAMWMEKNGFHATNIVFMGTGEPLLNWENVAAAIGVFNDPEGLNIGARNITVSTAGVIEGIRKFSELGLQVRLSVSLHFCDNGLRSRWMPVNRANPLPDLMAELRRYQAATDRLVTFEYILFDGLNDHLQAADDLRKLCAGLKYKVNLIPYNEVTGLDFRPPKPGKAEKFRDYLIKKGINITIRRKRGSDIDAACGQLRAGSQDPRPDIRPPGARPPGGGKKIG